MTRAELRRMPYKEFLQTEFWRAVRELVIERAQGICEMCGDERQCNLEIHHRTYKNHGREDEHLEDLLCLCDECHDDVERKGLRAWPHPEAQSSELRSVGEFVAASWPHRAML